MIFKLKSTLFWMALFSILTLTAVGITYKSTSSLVKKTIYEQLHVLTIETAKTIELWLNQQIKILNATADSIDYQNIGRNPATLGPLKMAMKAGHFSDVYIGLPDGNIIDGADWVPPATYDTRIRPWYLRAIEVGHSTVTKPYIDLVTMELVIALVTPLIHDDNFVGVMSADTILDSLVENIVNVKIGETGYAFIVEKNGMILVHPNQDYVMKSRLDEIEPQLKWNAEQVRDLKYGTIAYQGKMNGEEQLLTYQQVPNTDWYLCTIVPLSEAYDLTQKATILSAVEIVLLVLGGLAFVTLLGVGGSALVLLVFSQNFKTTVRKQREEISGISENLKWNITKRKEVETYYQTLFNVANDAILLSNKLYLIECNNRAEEMFGGGRDEVLGQSILDLSPEYQPDGHASHSSLTSVVNNSEAGELQFFVWTFRRLDGTDFPAEVGLNVFNLHGEELILYSIRDISKRVNAEEQLRQAQKMAAMGEMLGAIAHQWRQPLNTLSTYIASVQSAYMNNLVTAAFIERMVSGADSQIQFMSKTIDDFRHFFRPTKHKSPFDLIATINSSVKLVQPHLEQNKIALSITPMKGASALIVDGYQSEFVHVLINILNNAMDSIKEQNSAERQVDIFIETGHGIVEIRIQDTGGGIPERLLPKIFDPYVTTKGTSSGTGLGLYMAKSIVENEMKGLLSAANTAVGSLFTIQLPYSSLEDKTCQI